MKKIMRTGMAIIGLAFIFAFTLTNTWNISPDYNIAFDSDDASGNFEKFTGKIVFDPATLKSSSFNVSIDVASISTGNWLQDKHAKSDDWFDAEKYPVITFRSTKVLKTKTGYFAEGPLTIRGIKKNIKIPFTFKPNGNSGVFDGTFTVNRMDFKIGKEGEVKDLIKVKIKVPVKK